MNAKTVILILLASILIGGCGPKQLYLVGPKIGDEQPDILKICLNKALKEIDSGALPLTSTEKIPLKGVQTEYFLWWGSLSGPKPVITNGHLPGEARTAMPWLNSSKEISDRYVLCLLVNGYEFPSEEWVKDRFGESLPLSVATVSNNYINPVEKAANQKDQYTKITFFNNTNLSLYPLSSEIGIEIGIDGMRAAKLKRGQYIDLYIKKGLHDLRLTHWDVFKFSDNYTIELTNDNYIIELTCRPISTSYEVKHELPKGFEMVTH